jgi:hypothetical protein
MSGRRIDLSATQVIASVLAAVTGAIAASYLGVAGTIIGTAVMSVAGTAGAAIYKHILGRGRERLKSAAAQMTPAAYRRQASGRAGAASAETEILPAYREWRRPYGDDQATRRLSGAGPVTRWHAGHSGEAVPAGPGWTRPVAGSGAGQPDWRADATRRDIMTGGPGARRAGARRPAGGGRRPRWLVPATAALCVFLAVLGIVTAFEAAAGRPLDALIWGRHGTGTSVGSLVVGSPGGTGGRHVRHQPRHRHPASPAPARPSPSLTPTPSPTRTPSPAPSPSGTPGPSGSPSPAPTAGTASPRAG